MPANRVPRALLIALASVVVLLVALPLVAQAFLPMEPQPGASTRTTAVVATPTGTVAVVPEAILRRHMPDGELVRPARRVDVVVAEALAQVGARYNAVGDRPETGFSCVGLVRWAFARAGIAVPTSVPELATAYPRVPGATAKGAHLAPGDILLYHDTGLPGLSHASIYVGDQMMVSADSPETGVRLERIDSAYWVAHWSGAVRVPEVSRYAVGVR